MTCAHLVTQAYGSEAMRTHALYAVWSALAWRQDLPLEIHVYTDARSAFSALEGLVHLRVLSRDEIGTWRGRHDFVHRLKPLMIRDLTGRVRDEKLLYVDADSAFVAPVSRLFDRIGAGRAVLHVREYNIETHATGQMRRFRRHMRRVSFRGEPIDMKHGMWNAGVVGLDPGHFPIIDEWIAMLDEVYEQWPYWIHEQYVISCLLERAGKISPADDVVLHYWGQKDDALSALRPELELLASLPMEAALERIRANPLRLPSPVRSRTTWLEQISRYAVALVR